MDCSKCICYQCCLKYNKDFDGCPCDLFDSSDNYITINHASKLMENLFGDKCACNYNDIDEWLPLKCPDTDKCPESDKCWEYFIRYAKIN